MPLLPSANAARRWLNISVLGLTRDHASNSVPNWLKRSGRNRDMGTQQAQVQMPQYQCHKKGWALKIKSVERRLPTIEELQVVLDGGPEREAAMLIPERPGYGPIAVSQ